MRNNNMRNNNMRNNIRNNFNFSEIKITEIYSLLSVYPKQESFIFNEQECLNLIKGNQKYRKYNISAIYYDKDMIGLSIYSWSKTTGKNIIIDNFFIDKKWQNKGFGEKSFKEIIKDIYKKNLEVRNINLFVHPDNNKAVKLFRKCGFYFTISKNEYNEKNMHVDTFKINHSNLDKRLTMVHYKLEYCSHNIILKKMTA